MRRLTTTGSNAINWNVSTAEEEIAADERAFLRSLRERECYADQERLEMEASRKEKTHRDAIEQLFGNKHRSAEQIKEDREYDRFINAPIKMQVTTSTSSMIPFCCDLVVSGSTVVCSICTAGDGLCTDPDKRTIPAAVLNQSMVTRKKGRLDSEMRFWCPEVRQLVDYVPFNGETSKNFYAKYISEAENFHSSGENSAEVKSIYAEHKKSKATSAEQRVCSPQREGASMVCVNQKKVDRQRQREQQSNCNFSMKSNSASPVKIKLQCTQNNMESNTAVASMGKNLCAATTAAYAEKVKNQVYSLRPRHLRARNKTLNDNEYVVDLKGMSFDDAEPRRCYQCLLKRSDDCSHVQFKQIHMGIKVTELQPKWTRKGKEKRSNEMSHQES